MAARRPAAATKKRPATTRKRAAPAAAPAGPVAERLRSAVAALERLGDAKIRAGYARYGIVAPKSFGVPMREIQGLAKRLGRDHELAAALWKSGWYEARLLTSFVDDPARVTPGQMDRWAADFDNWGVCDTVCFQLFDRTPHAFAKIEAWADRPEEFVRRAAFALLASVAGHDRNADDAAFLRCLPLIERAAPDERNFVKKGVSWALRGIGHRNLALHEASVALARRLAEDARSPVRFIGKDALRDLTRPAVAKRLAAKSKRLRT